MEFLPLFAHNDPAVTVVVLVLLGGHILLEVDAQHPFEILLGGPAGGESVVIDALLDAAEVRKHIRKIIQNSSMIGLVMDANPKYEPDVMPVRESTPLSVSTISVATSPMEVPYPVIPAVRLACSVTESS